MPTLGQWFSGRPAPVAACALLLLVAGCGGEGKPQPRRVDRGTSRLVQAFERAERRWKVPAVLLMAVAYRESRFSQHPDVASRLGGFGLMHLRRGGPLELAAQLSGQRVSALRHDANANIDGAAALLATLARRDGRPLPARLSGWRNALRAYAGLDARSAEDYAQAVLATIVAGASGVDDEGNSLVIAARPEGLGSLPPWIGARRSMLRPDFPGARWVGPACGTSGRGRSISMVVIHTCQGGFSGCVSWLKGCHSSSAHYVVSSSGRVDQLVDERLAAWHATCVNSRSIGIEHEGWVQDPAKWFTEKMYCASATLVRSICKRYGFACDRSHVIGHVEANRRYCGGSHTDPGRGWDWTKFMRYVNRGCGAPAKSRRPQMSISSRIASISQQARDFCRQRKSEGIFDWRVGQRTTISVDVKNTGDAIAKNTDVGIWSEAPFLEVKRWKIESNWKAGATFKVNDTDAKQKVPRENPGQTFRLWLGSISPGETKRVTLTVKALRYSIGAADHPDLRAWIAHVDNVYEKASFGAKPNNVGGHQKQNGGDLKTYAQTDVFDRERCDGIDNDCDGLVDEDTCNPSGQLDAADCEDGFSGWADGAAEASVTVEIYVDSQPETGSPATITLRANRERPDLCETPASCKRGFTAPIPPRYRDGQTHRVSAYARGAKDGKRVELAGSPSSFACSAVEGSDPTRGGDGSSPAEVRGGCTVGNERPGSTGALWLLGLLVVILWRRRSTMR